MSELEQLRAEFRALRDEIAALHARMAQRIEVHHYHHAMPAPVPVPSPYRTPWDSPNVCESAGLQIEMGPGVTVEMCNGRTAP